MSFVAIAMLAFLAILLLGAVVCFGIGQSRWSVASVVASFLIVLTLGGFLYLASRLLKHEWDWASSARAARVKLTRLEEGAGSGPAAGIDDLSIASLEELRNRWQRALTAIDTWRGRRWQHATFHPPAADGDTGTLEIPPPAAGDSAGDPNATEAAPASAPPDLIPPLVPGMTVYLFQDGPISDGGRYLGEFLVDAVTTTADGGFDVTVSQKAQRDAYDAEAWGKDWDDVVVFDELPTDRWTAFSETPVAAPEEPEGAAADDSAAVAPRPRMRDKTELEMLVPEPFRPDVAEHTLSGDDVREGIPESKWPAIRAALASGEKLPGEYWAQVTFSTPQARDDFLGLQEAGSGNSFEVEFDTAFDLADAGKVKIDKVFSRRRLLNAETRMHGSVMPTIEPEGPKVIADGLATIMRLLKRDLTDLQEFNRQLDGSLASAVSEKELLSLQAEELSADLKIWERDVAAADKTAAAFAAAVEAASSRLESAERRVVELGRELDAEVGRAVREIDLVAPPPAGRAAGRSAAAF